MITAFQTNNKMDMTSHRERGWPKTGLSKEM